MFLCVSIEMPDGKVEKNEYWDEESYVSFNVGDKLVKRLNEKKPANV